MDPIISLLEAPEQLSTEGFNRLTFMVQLPEQADYTLTIVANGVSSAQALVNTDLLAQDVILKPGESTAITVGVQPRQLGTGSWKQIGVEVKRSNQTHSSRIPLPDKPVRVVPSLARAITISMTPICPYIEGLKIEVELKNSSGELIQDLSANLEPAGQIRSGPLQLREASLMPGASRKFESVIRGDEVCFQLRGTIQGQQVATTIELPIPEYQPTTSTTDRQFRFLEPRSFTQDRIQIVAQADGRDIFSNNGVFPVHGGNSRYLLKITPSDPRVSSLRVYTAAGQIEVEAQARVGTEWPFLLTVVSNPKLTELIRLDYDIELEGAAMRGEIFFSVRPSGTTMWFLAFTAGLTLTVKGGVAILAVFARSELSLEELYSEFHTLLQQRPTDLLQMICIPAIYSLHRAVDIAWRWFLEE